MMCIFEKVEILNAEFQKESLNFHKAHSKINANVGLLAKLKENGFEEIWAEAENKARTLGLEDPIKIIRKNFLFK